MRDKFNLLVSCMAIALSTWGCASPAPRVAMVIGIGHYQHATPLSNPPNDARAIAERLAALDWKVETAIDVGEAELEDAIEAFEEQVARSDQAIFYYTGHSMQINGGNYLVPVEFEPSTASIEKDLVSLDRAVERMATSPGQVAILVDAGRDNSLAMAFAQTSPEGGKSQNPEGATGLPPGRHFSQGLAEIPVRTGMFVAYATAPGHVALDGSGTHSPFVRALLDHIDLENQDVRTLLVRVREDVFEATGGSQVPWDSSSLTRPFLIHATPTPTGSPPTP